MEALGSLWKLVEAKPLEACGSLWKFGFRSVRLTSFAEYGCPAIVEILIVIFEILKLAAYGLKKFAPYGLNSKAKLSWQQW